MTLRNDMSGLFNPGAAPDGPGLARWVAQQFANLRLFLQQPEFSSVLLLRVDVALPPDFKAEDGMLVYAGPNVLGTAAGLYVREAGAWKKVTSV